MVHLKRPRRVLFQVDEKQSDTDIEGARFHTMVGRQYSEYWESFFLCCTINNGDNMANINCRVHVGFINFINVRAMYLYALNRPVHSAYDRTNYRGVRLSRENINITWVLIKIQKKKKSLNIFHCTTYDT